MSSELSPFQTLKTLAQRVRDNAAPLPDRSKASESWQAIAFEFMNDIFVVPMKDVKEVLPTPGATRIPGVKQWVKGIANVRGEILALVDLNSFISSRRTSNPNLSRVVAVEIGTVRFGLIVDRVIGMRQVNQAQIQPGTTQACPQEMAEYMSGSAQIDEYEVNLFDPMKLVNSDTFSGLSTL